ncbi:MAG: hypothetical protein NTX25_06510, partial [Proteobacteria bacterium]|nr:hypothetical protein [Pseudomonadota bacterium]
SSEILILATDSELIQLDGHSGVESYHFAWDKRCQLAKLIQTRSYDYYIGLKTLRGYVSAEVFHCEMLHWQGASADPQKVLASSFLQKDNFTGFDPDKFRIEELLELNYNSQRNWLLISRSLDSRFILYDLNQNKGEIITLTQDGFPRIVRVSDNGKFLTLAWALVGKNSLQIYSIPDADKLMSLNDIFSEAPLLDLQNRPKSISDIGFSEAHDMIFTADEARQINSYSLQETLLPKSPDQFIVPTQISKNQTALSWIHGQLKRLDHYGRVLNTWEPPSGIEFTQALDTDDGPLALDGFGKLWSHGLAPDSNEWKTIDTAALNQAKLVVSPSQQLALVFGKDRETGVGQVYLLKKDGHTWLQVATLQADGEQAAFSANEEYFALAGRKEQSLWTTDGTLLQKLKQANESFQAGLRYQAFSADSSLWLLRFGNKLRFFDTIHREFLKQDITLQFQPGYVGFAGTDHEHLWVGTRGGGTSQFLYEMNLYGQISRDFGEFTSMIVEVFNFQDRLLAVDKIGQVLSLKTARESAEVLIASSMQKTSELLDYQADKGLLLVTPNAQAVHQFLFLNFAPEHVDSLCAWLLPTLRAAADEEAQGQLEFCQQRLTKSIH